MATFFRRITEVISANIDDMIDRVEDPDRMIKRIIREMEDNARRAKEGVIDAIASEKQLALELKRRREDSDKWARKAEEALRAGNEELARAALARKKERDGVARELEASWERAKSASGMAESKSIRSHVVAAYPGSAPKARSAPTTGTPSSVTPGALSV